jgi:hypothetical protein
MADDDTDGLFVRQAQITAIASRGRSLFAHLARVIGREQAEILWQSLMLEPGTRVRKRAGAWGSPRKPGRPKGPRQPECDQLLLIIHRHLQAERPDLEDSELQRETISAARSYSPRCFPLPDSTDPDVVRYADAAIDKRLIRLIMLDKKRTI